MQPTHFFFDVDSTVIAGESLQDMVALALAGEADTERREAAETELRSITNAGMNGDIGFEESLEKRLALACVTKQHMETMTNTMLRELTPGIREFMEAVRGAGHGTWLLTAGLREMMLPLARELGIPDGQVFGNEPLWLAGRLQGFEPGPLLKTDGKAAVIRELKARGRITGSVVMVGDGMSDLTVFTSGAADDFYGFGGHAVRPNVEKNAPHFFRSVAEMRAFMAL